MLGWAMGQGEDTTSTGTDCYTYTRYQADRWETLQSAMDSLSSADDIKTFFSELNSFLIGSSDQMTACQDINKIKQFHSRVSSASGYMGLITTLVWGYFDDNSQFREAWNAMSSGSLGCQAFGNYLSQLVSYTLENKTSKEVM
jgi:hypothetical protein